MQSFETDVLVVGAGPGGSAAAYHLARHGVDVTVVEKAAFPREKVCGDGLTPRSVKAIMDMGIDTDDPGFEKVIGLRVHARRTTIQLPWPDLTSFPPYGLVMPREGFDHLLAQRAVKAGARLLERTEAVAPRFVDGYVAGATVRPAGERDTEPTEIRARYVLAADGAASRFASAGRRATRPRAAARHRGAPLLPRRLPPGAVDRVVARPVGRRPPAARATAGCSRSPAGGSTSARGC